MRKYYFLLIMFYLISCQEKTTSDIPVVNVSDVTVGEILVSDYFSSVEYIPLESVDRTMLSSITRFFLSGDDIVVIDNEIMLFDKATGKFKRTVSRKGQGPNEYIHLFYSSFYENSYSVLTDRGNQWMEISIETGMGRFITKPDTKDLVRFSSNTEKNSELSMFMKPIVHTLKFNDNLYAGYVSNINGDTPVKLVYYNPDGEILTRIPNYLTFENNEDITIQYSPVFNMSGDRILFKETGNDTVFVLTEDAAIPVYFLDFGSKAFLYNQQDDEFKSANSTTVKMMFETDDDFFFQYTYQSKKYMGVMNKKTLQVNIAEDGFANDMHDFISLLPTYQNLSGEIMCVIPADIVVNHYKTHTLHPSLAHLYDVKEDDNPIIAILTLK